MRVATDRIVLDIYGFLCVFKLGSVSTVPISSDICRVYCTRWKWKRPSYIRVRYTTRMYGIYPKEYYGTTSSRKE